MTEIKISEHRFLSLIESEKVVPVIMIGVIRFLIDKWKETNPYKTEKEREPLERYVSEKLQQLGIPIKAGFNNNYHCIIQFYYAGDYHNVGVTEIDTSTGLSIEK